MPLALDKALDRTPEGFQALTWILYVASCGLAAFTLGEISGTLLFLGCIVVIVLASSREKDAAATIYASHLANIRKTMTVIVTWPIYLCFLVWTGFKLIRGLMKLNDGQPY